MREVRGVGLQVTRLEAVGSGQSLKGVLKLYCPLSFTFKYFIQYTRHFQFSKFDEKTQMVDLPSRIKYIYLLFIYSLQVGKASSVQSNRG